MMITVQDQLLAARMCLACADSDEDQLRLVLADLTADQRPGGVVPMLIVMGNTNASMARQIEGENFRDSLRAAVAYLTQRAEIDGPDSPAELA